MANFWCSVVACIAIAFVGALICRFGGAVDSLPLVILGGVIIGASGTIGSLVGQRLKDKGDSGG